jgi:lysophospholipase L1-like esterase
MARQRRPLSNLKKASFGLMTLAVLLGGAEVFFQIRDVVRERRKPRLPMVTDPYRGTVLVPNSVYDRSHDQGRRATINSLGFRGPEVSAVKPPGTFRIVTVGGSTTYGLYTSADEKTWPARLQAHLRMAGHPDVEVINAGAPGWTLRISLTNLELKVWDLQPDLVVCYHNFNDLIDLGSQESAARYIADAQIDDVSQLYRPPPNSLLEMSALFQFIKSRLRDDYETFVDKRDDLDPQGLLAFEQNLRRLVRRAREQGAEVVLCTYPTSFRPTYEESQQAQVPELERWYDSLSPMTYPVLMEGIERNNDTIRRVGQDLAVPVVELAETMPHDVSLYMSPIHHSDAGEEAVASRIAADLEASQLLDRVESAPSAATAQAAHALPPADASGLVLRAVALAFLALVAGVCFGVWISGRVTELVRGGQSI